MACTFRNLRLFAGALGLICLAACSGGGGDTSAVPAPSNLTVTWAANVASTLQFSWTAAAGAVDGYAVEGRMGSQDFADLGEVLAPSTSAYLSVDPTTMPELTDLAFRMRSFKGSAYSGYSNVASVRTGLRPPTFTAYQSIASGIDLTWTNNSSAATTLTLERGIADSYGSPTTWTTLPDVAFGTTHYLDTQCPENAYVVYRVTYAKGSDKTSAVTQSISMTMRSPSDLVATAGQERVHLAWVNHSSSATEVVVCRAPGLTSYQNYTDVAHLTPGTTSYDDLQLPTGAYTYKVEARLQGTNYYPTTAACAPVQVLTQPMTSGGLALTASVAAMPTASGGALSSQGAWYLAQTTNYNSTFTIFTPSAGTWTSHALTNPSGMMAPYLLLDGQDHPHTVYLRDAVSGGSEKVILHSWFDGSTWQVEEIARRTFSSASSYNLPAMFALDTAGDLSVIWNTGTSYNLGLEYASKVNGVWTVESMAAAVPANNSLYSFDMVVDSNGTPCVNLVYYNGSVLLFRQGPGQWTTETLPSGSSTVSIKRMLYTADGDLHAWYLDSATYNLTELRRSGGTWGAPQVLQACSSSDYNLSLAAAQDPLSGRIALVCQGNGSGLFLLINQQGTWTRSTLAGGNSGSLTLAGFDAAGKLHVAQDGGATAYNATTVPYLSYTEP